MKVVLCTHRFVPPFVGGVDVYTERLGQALLRLGIGVKIFAFDPTVELAGKEIIVSKGKEYKGIEVWRFGFLFSKRPPIAYYYAYDPEIGAILKRALQDQKPDLLVIMNFYMITLAAVEVAKELEIPVVHIATDFIPICRQATLIRWNGESCLIGESIKSCAQCFVSQNPLGRLASVLLNQLPESTLVKLASKYESYKSPNPLRILMPYLKQIKIMEQRLKTLGPLREKIDLILTPTRYTLNMFQKNGFNAEQLYFLPFGVEIDNPLSKIEKLPAAYIRFLFIGRFQPYKGAHILIEAFNNLPTPNGATLTVYGTADDGYRAYFNELITMMNSNERIRYAGQIAPDHLSKAFAEADIFVLPSTWHENSPLILLDALQSKTPVIASDIGGVTDIVKDGVNGLLFPMGQSQALRHAMQSVIDRPNMINQLQSGAKLHSIDDYAGTMLELYQEKEYSHSESL